MYYRPLLIFFICCDSLCVLVKYSLIFWCFIFFKYFILYFSFVIHVFVIEATSFVFSILLIDYKLKWVTKSFNFIRFDSRHCSPTCCQDVHVMMCEIWKKQVIRVTLCHDIFCSIKMALGRLWKLYNLKLKLLYLHQVIWLVEKVITHIKYSWHDDSHLTRNVVSSDLTRRDISVKRNKERCHVILIRLSLIWTPLYVHTFYTKVIFSFRC